MHILALPYGHSVAHTSRLLEIAGALRARGHTISFAGSGGVLRIARQAGFTVWDLADEALEVIVQALHSTSFARLYGDPDKLERWVRAELDLYARLEPDLVLSDDRRTAALSAALAGLPHVAVVNAHVTNASAHPLLLPDYRCPDPARARSPRLRALYGLQAAIERRVYHGALGGFVKLRRRLGLPPAYAYDVAAGNDLTLVPDVPEFTPLARPPATMRPIGPLTWRSELPPPASLEAFLARPRRVLFNLGSGGPPALVARLAAAAPPGYAFMVAAGEGADTALSGGDGVFVERYVNADLLLPHCDAVVCHGGNGTVYQALRHGVPVVALPTHNEQDYNARRAEQLGLGLRVHARAALRDFRPVLRALEAVVGEPAYGANARRFQTLLAAWDGPALAADLIEGLAARRAPAGSPTPV